MGLFSKKNNNNSCSYDGILSSKEQRELRQELIARLDKEFLNDWKTTFATNDEDRRLANAALKNLIDARHYLDNILHKSDSRVWAYANKISKAIDKIKENYLCYVGAIFIADNAGIIWQAAQDWARL